MDVVNVTLRNEGLMSWYAN